MSDTDPSADRLDYVAWADRLRDGELLGQECAECGHTTAAPKATCVRCGSRTLAAVTLPTDGIVHSETTIGVPPEGFDGEYQVAVVRLGDAKVLGRIDGAVDIGDRVSFADVLVADDHPAPVFEPV